jgi:hypothetical protein
VVKKISKKTKSVVCRFCALIKKRKFQIHNYSMHLPFWFAARCELRKTAPQNKIDQKYGINRLARFIWRQSGVHESRLQPNQRDFFVAQLEMSYMC